MFQIEFRGVLEGGRKTGKAGSRVLGDIADGFDRSVGVVAVTEGGGLGVGILNVGCCDHRDDDQGEKGDKGNCEDFLAAAAGGWSCCLIFEVLQLIVTFDEVDGIHFAAANGCSWNLTPYMLKLLLGWAILHIKVQYHFFEPTAYTYQSQTLSLSLYASKSVSIVQMQILH